MPRIETHKKLNHNKNRTMLLNEEEKKRFRKQTIYRNKNKKGIITALK